MPQPLAPGTHAVAVPRFYVTPRQRLGAGPVLLAVVVALICLVAVVYALAHSRHGHGSGYGSGGPQFGRAGFGAGSAADDDDDDDPSRVDTIYLGDAGQAPTATRPSAHASAVHPFVVVQLPRSGNQVGQIPDSPAGRLLYAWLAAFNGSDPSAFAKALPTRDDDLTGAAQVELRKQTGGFTLVSAREVQPGVLVFRLHDQTAAAAEVLGTLQVRAGSHPASIASFSLAAAPQPQAKP